MIRANMATISKAMTTSIVAGGRMGRLGCAALAALVISTAWAGNTPRDSGGYSGADAGFSFIDLSVSGGSASVLANQDDSVALLTLPFSFVFYGTPYTMLCVSSNGLAYFVTGSSACAAISDFQNVDLTAAGTAGNLPAVIPYWTDLVFQGTGSAVYYQTQGSAGSRKFVLQWNNAYPQATVLSANPVTFELVLYETSNQILFQYKTVDLGAANPASKGAQSTVGIRDASGNTSGRETEWSYNAAVLNDNSAILFSGSQALRFVPITPCRIVDTRNATGPFGGPIIGGGSSRDFTVPSSACSIPATAQAYSLNVAVVPATTLGYLTLWPTGQTRPLASTLNSLDGRIKSNAAIVPAGTNGAVSVFASDTTHVILDINGYFVPATDPTGLAFYPITPCRIADTRTAAAPLGGPSLAGGQNRTFPILSSTCNLPATAKAYSLNFAAVPSGSLGYLTAWPTGQARPLAASLNALTGAITANAAIVPAGTNGSIDVFASNTTNLVIDINGYFAPIGAGGLSLYGVTPCRVVDTRLPAGSPPITSLDVAVSASACGIPANAQAHVLSVTVVPPGSLGYLTLWPQGQTRPVVSTLNALDGAITSNMAIVPTSNGTISAFPSNPTHLIIDISGYFAQ